MVEEGPRDHDELPPKCSKQEREVHQGPRNRTVRKQWSPPEWLRRLAEQAPQRLPRLERKESRVRVAVAANATVWQPINARSVGAGTGQEPVHQVRWLHTQG
eukprot:5844556-Amphidinium_carterae.1